MRVLILLAFLVVPAFALDTPRDGCVKRSGAIYLIGPQYRRQACRASETPTTILTRQVVALNSAPLMRSISAATEAPAVAFTSSSNPVMLDTEGRIWAFNTNSEQWTLETNIAPVPDPIETISVWDIFTYTTINGDVHDLQECGSLCGAFVQHYVNIGHP